MSDGTERAGNRSLSRRALIERGGVGFGALFLAGALGACGGDDDSSSASSAAPAASSGGEASSAAAPASSGGGGSGGETIKVGFVSPITGPAAGFGEPDGYVLGLARKALAGGLQIGGKTYAGRDHRQGRPVDPAARGAGREGPDHGDGIDLMLATSTPEIDQPGRRRVRGGRRAVHLHRLPWEAWYFGRGAKPGASPRRSSTRYHFCFGVEEFDKTYAAPVAAGPDEQEGRRDVAQRRRRQRHPRHPRAAAREGRLHHRRPGRVRGRHERLLVADREVQEGELRDLQHLPDPAGLRHLLAAGGAAGLHADGKIAQIAKTGLFPSQVEALGDRSATTSRAASTGTRPSRTSRRSPA